MRRRAEPHEVGQHHRACSDRMEACLFIGIAGLNVGKSTLFQRLDRATIARRELPLRDHPEPNVGVVPCPTRA